MAYTAGKVKSNYIDVAVGDGNVDPGPELYTVVCGLVDRSLNVTYASAFEAEDYDCDDPEAVAQTLREVGAQDWSIDISGLYNRSQMALIRGLLGSSHNWQFIISEPAADSIDDGQWTGTGFINNFSVQGTKGTYTQLSATIQGTGLLAWTDAA